MPNFGLGFLYSVLLLKITWNLSITAEFHYYFHDQDMAIINTTDMSKFLSNDIRDLYIDLIYNSYVQKVTVELTVAKAAKDVEISLFGDPSVKKKCTPAFEDVRSTQVYVCNKLARIIKILGTEIIRNIAVEHHETFLDGYLGCFRVKHLEGVEPAYDLEGCSEKCSGSGSSTYFGFNTEKKCACFRNLNAFTPVSLDKCNTKCQGKIQFCGSKAFFSIYSKALRTENKRVYQKTRCFFDQRICQTCPNGKKGFNCEYADCNRENGGCVEEERCKVIDLQGSQIGLCLCTEGFTFDDNMKCKDVDECEDATICSGADFCKNKVGSYQCGCKDDGYKYEKGECRDIDECKEKLCDKFTTSCENLPGNYTCNCLEGFSREIYSEDRHRCSDIDECKESTCDFLSSICLNLFGDFECVCRIGFVRPKYGQSRKICEDIDECRGSTFTLCPDGIECFNTPGSYDCRCPEGTIRIEYYFMTECQDIDECVQLDLCNLSNSFCVNTIASFLCACRPGYINVNDFTCEASDGDELTTPEDLYTTTSGNLDYLERTVRKNLFYSALALLVITAIISVTIFLYKSLQTDFPGEMSVSISTLS